MFGLDGKKVRYHFDGVHGKVTQMRELVEVIDTMLDSFHRVNKLSKNILGQEKPQVNKIQRLR